MYTNSPKFKSCYEKLRKSYKTLKRRVKGRLSPSARAVREAAERSIHNKCIKKLKLKVPLLKPSSKRSKRSKRQNGLKCLNKLKKAYPKYIFGLANGRPHYRKSKKSRNVKMSKTMEKICNIKRSSNSINNRRRLRIRNMTNKRMSKSKRKKSVKRKSKSKRSKKSKKKSRARRKRNDGSDVVKDVSWISYYKRYYNDPTFDVKRIDWTGYQGRLPAGSKIRVSKSRRS